METSFEFNIHSIFRYLKFHVIMAILNQLMKTINTKWKIFGTRETKVEEAFPIDTLLQNPGYDLISRNIFKYLKLKDFENCRLVSKSWKQFIDEDKYLAKVQLTEVFSLYSKRKYIRKITPFNFVCRKSSVRIVKLFLDCKVSYSRRKKVQD